MDVSVGFYLLLLFLILISLSIPIAIAIALSSLVIMISILPFDVALMTAGQKLVTGVDSFSLLAIPFFILAGNIMNKGGIATRLINFARLLVGNLSGGLAHVNVLSNMMFGAVSGSAVASAAAVGKTLSPEYKKEGYDKAFATAVNVASCPAGLLIPPSNALIVFSVVSGGTSVAALFVAGYIPGVLMGLTCMLVAYVVAKRKGYGCVQKKRKTFREKLQITWEAVPSLGLVVVVIGGIIGGVFTATEGACIAVLYALILSVCYGTLSIRDMKCILIESTEIIAIMLFLIGASTIMSWAMAFTGLPSLISDWMLGISDNAVVIFIMMNIILLLVGMFMDLTPALLIFTPIFMPISQALGMEPIHFAMMIIFNLCIGIATPPVGTALFVGCSVSGEKIESVIKAIIPFCLLLILTLLAITFIPQISLFLPKWFGLIQ